ncbi:MAG: stalk domain-containing protein [Oscillospiraceae bacterium]|nr:stalk domain-containing protein [Oscillospiraceae bacterium]
MIRYKPIIVLLLIIICLPISLMPATASSTIDAPHLSLYDFLNITGLDFESYHNMMASASASGRYPHFLEGNRQRYEAFRARNPEIPFAAVIAYVNVNADLGFYRHIEPVRDPYEIHALVNKNFGLPSGFQPSDFVDIGTGHLMRAEAAEHFRKMSAEIRDAGLRVQVIVTFRSYQTQAGTHGRGVSRFGQASADRQFARPGHSEHQLGLAVDILQRSGFEFMTQARFQNTREYAWLLENGHRFGFILRYPNEYRHIHGYIYEPWHWRFVGVDVATAMHHEGIALLEEFYGRYLDSRIFNRVLKDLMGKTYPRIFGMDVFYDGQALSFDVPPRAINNRIVVPLRAIFEALGATVRWDAATQTVTASTDDTVVVMTIGCTFPTVNGQIVEIDLPGVVVNGRTLAPLRFVAEAFGRTVDWDAHARTASLAAS